MVISDRQMGHLQSAAKSSALSCRLMHSCSAMDRHMQHEVFHTIAFLAFSCLAFSTPATWCRIFMPRNFMSRIFSVPKIVWPERELTRVIENQVNRPGKLSIDRPLYLHYSINGQSIAHSLAGTSAGFLLGAVNAPLLPEAKKIVKIWVRNGAFWSINMWPA